MREADAGPVRFGNEVARRFDSLTIAAIVLEVLTIVLVGIASTLPWWAFFTNGDMTAWYLGNRCGGGTCTSYYGYPSLRDTFGLTGALVLWGLTLYILALAALVVSLVWPRIGFLVLVLGILGSILFLVAPVYLYLALPGALSSAGFSVPVDGFFGSGSQTGFFGTTQYSWTGAAGWFMMWGVFLFSLAATTVAFITARRRTMELEETESREVGTVERTRGSRGLGTSEGRAFAKFCPVCGAHYSAGTRFCSKDATPLKELV